MVTHRMKGLLVFVLLIAAGGENVCGADARATGGTVTNYVGEGTHWVAHIFTGSKGLAKSPWPMRGQNARHTGRVPK